jgi:hypothetical protein
VDIADLHGLGYRTPQDPAQIAASNAEFRRVVPNATVCFNSDGCQSQPRYEKEWIKAAIRNAWSVGGFFETKGIDENALQSILQAFREIKAER